MSPSRAGATLPLLLALALGVRWLYVHEVAESDLVRFLSVDSQAYHRRALEILSGGWLGHGVFYQDPLYPYFLAALYALFGTGSTGVLLAQATLDAVTVGLVYGIAVTLFERRVALLSGLFAALYGPFLYYDALVLKVTLSVFLLTAALFCLVRAHHTRRPAGWLAGGLALGLACLTRGNYLVLVPVVGLWQWGVMRGEPARLRRAAGLLAAGLALVLVPTAVRNRVVGGDWVLVTSQAGQNFFIGNQRDNDTGTFAAPPFVVANPSHEELDFAREARRRSGREMGPSALSRFWFGEALHEIRSDPGHFAWLLLRKTRLFFNAYEIPDNQDYQFFEQHVSRLLALPLPDFGFLLPLALCGGFFARRNRGAWLLLLCFGAYAASVILFYNMSRYRIPVAPIVIVFSGVAGVELFDALRRREKRTLLVSGCTLLVAYPLVHQEILRFDWSTQHYNLGTHLVREAERHAARADELAAAGDAARAADEGAASERLLDRAERELRLGLEIRPGHPSLKTAHRLLLLSRVREAQSAGRDEQAVALARKLTDAYPRLAEGWLALGTSLARTGDLRGADVALARALQIAPGHPEARRARAALRAGRPAGELRSR